MRSSSRSCGASRFFARTRDSDAGWSSLVARRAHNPKVAGSNPAPAIYEKTCKGAVFSSPGAFAVPRAGNERVTIVGENHAIGAHEGMRRGEP
jgi:hypothetical protein